MPGNRWTKPQIESLIEQIVQQKKPLPEIGIEGKSRAAINNQRKRLQRAGFLNGAFSGREVKPWTFPELKKLTAFTQEYGFSASFIAQMGLLPGRSKDSISKMMGRHGLGNPVVKERARQARRLDVPRREEFREFLLGEGRLLPSIEVARQWGVAQKTVTAYRRRLGIRLSWEEARSSEEFRRQQERRAQAFVEHTRERWRQWRERKKAGWEKLKQEMAQRPDCPPARACEACGEQWFASREFFHVRLRRLPDRVKTSYSRVCRLCRAEQRRRKAASRRGDQATVAA
jgi:DNA-binding CsgD family transcriptional regulator